MASTRRDSPSIEVPGDTDTRLFGRHRVCRAANFATGRTGFEGTRVSQRAMSKHRPYRINSSTDGKVCF